MRVFDVCEGGDLIRAGICGVVDGTGREVIDEEETVVVIAQGRQARPRDVLPGVVLHHECIIIQVYIADWVPDGQVTSSYRHRHIACVTALHNRSNPNHSLSCIDVTRCNLDLARRRLHAESLRECVVNRPSGKDECDQLRKRQVDCRSRSVVRKSDSVVISRTSVHRACLVDRSESETGTTRSLGSFVGEPIRDVANRCNFAGEIVGISG